MESGRKTKVVWQEKQPNKRNERGERSKRQAGFDERSSLEPVKKRIKRVRSQEVGEKGEERWGVEKEEEESWEEKEEEDGKSVQFEPTERNHQMSEKDCKVTIGNVCNHHDP